MGAISTQDMSTNWTISRGSLETSITFESSDSPVDSESTQISPLILHRPSPDSSPCEIKLCFMEKHEIRQVYVRSTARVYEIYYAPTLQSDNEYLCTVHCSIAEKDGEFLQASGVEEVTQQYMKDYAGKPTDGRAEAKVCTSEDDWIEVKVPDSPFIGNRDSCLQNHTTGTEGRIIEDLYEATAQISDADPCMSITIRFLSLQNKDSVCIDEVYIFADPIDSDDMETPAVPMGNQASSFMAMLVPTLLQLSKSGGISQKQDKDLLDSQRKENEVENASRTSDFADAENENDKEKRMSADHLVQSDVIDKPIAEPTHSQPLTHQNLSRENHNFSTMNTDVSAARIERALEQLLDRVSRIENICLKFEENMVSPINSMETRIQRLEQQIEILAKSSQQPGVVAPSTRITAPSFTCSDSNCSSLYNDGSEYRPCGASELEKNDLPCNKSCTRIIAPSFTCSESNSTSLHNDGSEYQQCGASELEVEDTPCNRLSDLSDDAPFPSKTADVVSNRVITAPEFSCEEEEEENDIVESVKCSSQAMQKQVLSIDDALAAALSGFLSTSRVLPPDNGTSEVISVGEVVNEKNEISQSAQSASVIADDCTLEGNGNDRPSRYTQILAVAAPDFIDEECELENPNFITASSASGPELASEEDGNSGRASPRTGSQDTGGSIDLNGSKSKHCASLAVASEPYAEQKKFIHENVHLKETSRIVGSKDHHYAQESVCTLLDGATSFPSDQDDKVAETKGRDCTNEPQLDSHNLEHAGESEEHDASKSSHADVMQNVYENLKPSTLDFDIPILDVKFTGNENGDTKFSLEALLDGTSEVKAEAPSAGKNADNGITSEGITVTVMEELPEFSSGNGKPLLDYGAYAADTFTNLDGQSNPNISSNQEVFISLL